MSQATHTELQQKSQALLHGRLKHVKTAALAAALVPLAVVAVSTAEGQSCTSGGMVCGFVWEDSNNNGIQDAGELPIVGAVVTINGVSTATNDAGFWEFIVQPGTYQVEVQIPPGTQPSPANQGSNDNVDSDGKADGLGNSVATVTLVNKGDAVAGTDFGFHVPTQVVNPGTGTPGFWKNHPEAWPVQTIDIGGITYTKTQAIDILSSSVTKDKRITMFASLLSAKLNLLVGNDGSCVSSTITSADAWMASVGQVGTGVPVAASSLAWKLGEPYHRLMDNYNNGMLCAPHRD
jgi:hypothetical protein